MDSLTDVISLDREHHTLASLREQFKRDLFTQLLHAADDDAWTDAAQRLALRRGHLRLVVT